MNEGFLEEVGQRQSILGTRDKSFNLSGPCLLSPKVKGWEGRSTEVSPVSNIL